MRPDPETPSVDSAIDQYLPPAVSGLPAMGPAQTEPACHASRSPLKIRRASGARSWGDALRISSTTVFSLAAILVPAVNAADSSARPSPFSEKAEFQRYAEKLRESAIQSLEPTVRIPSSGATNVSGSSKSGSTSSSTSARTPIGSLIASAPFQSTKYYQPSGSLTPYVPSPYSLGSGKYPWKTKIVTTVFWVGESATVNNPVHNRSSSWDQNWKESFGGYDNPDTAKRTGFIPAAFVPKLNPFYFALPYNDITKGGHKPEARSVIPWFRQAFVRDGQSVCRDRWIAIRNASGRMCYAQWSDCGPYRTDHWEYVFGRARPIPNMNGGAGLDVSPAVRDYLKLNSIDVTDWKFVDFSEVPRGPWSDFGENNEFVQLARRSRDRMATNPSGGMDGPKVFAR